MRKCFLVTVAALINAVFFAGMLVLGVASPSYAAKLYDCRDIYIYVQGNYIFENKGNPPYDKIDPVIIDFRNKGGSVNWGMFFAWFEKYGKGLYPTVGEDLCQAENGNYWLRFPDACASVGSLKDVGFTIGGNGNGWGKVPIGADEKVDDAISLVKSIKTKLGESLDRLDFDLEDYPMMHHSGGIEGGGYNEKEWEEFFDLIRKVKKSVPGLRFTLTVSVASKYHWENSKGYKELVKSRLLSREDNPFDMVFLMCMSGPGQNSKAYGYSYWFKYTVKELRLESLLEKGRVIPMLDCWGDPNVNPKGEYHKLNEICRLLQDENETNDDRPELAKDQTEWKWKDLKGIKFNHIAFFTGDDGKFSVLKDVLKLICSK